MQYRYYKSLSNAFQPQHTEQIVISKGHLQAKKTMNKKKNMQESNPR